MVEGSANKPSPDADFFDRDSPVASSRGRTLRSGHCTIACSIEGDHPEVIVPRVVDVSIPVLDAYPEDVERLVARAEAPREGRQDAGETGSARISADEMLEYLDQVDAYVDVLCRIFPPGLEYAPDVDSLAGAHRAAIAAAIRVFLDPDGRCGDAFRIDRDRLSRLRVAFGLPDANGDDLPVDAEFAVLSRSTNPHRPVRAGTTTVRLAPGENPASLDAARRAVDSFGSDVVNHMAVPRVLATSLLHDVDTDDLPPHRGTFLQQLRVLRRANSG